MYEIKARPLLNNKLFSAYDIDTLGQLRGGSSNAANLTAAEVVDSTIVSALKRCVGVEAFDARCHLCLQAFLVVIAAIGDNEVVCLG